MILFCVHSPVFIKNMKKIEGTGLNSTFCSLEIRPNNEFLFYLHENSHQPLKIPLDIEEIRVVNHSVSLGKAPSANVVEHLFSALYGLGLFCVRIDLYGNEMPFFDGSSKEFVRILRGFKETEAGPVLRLNKRLEVRHGSSFIRYEPTTDELFIIDMELSHPYIRTQRLISTIDRETYVNEIAAARTFVFTEDSDARLKNLPPYGIGITKTGIYAAEPLRFSDEPVRHKILDLLGDLYVLNRKIVGKITARNSSHLLNQRFIRLLRKESIEQKNLF